jgi:hypothetical protein
VKKFIGFVLVLLLLAGGVFTYMLFQRGGISTDKLPLPLREALDTTPPEPPARAPQSYHILEDQGGVPLAEAERGGLAGDGYAYLTGLEPIQSAKAIERCQDCLVRGKRYDLCWRFNSEPGETQVLEFNIGGKYAELHLGCGFEDTHPSDTTGKLAVELSIQADGKEILSPVRLTPVDPPWFGFVPIVGAQRIAIVMRRVGYNNTLAPVLLDPFVRTALDQPRPGT